jgi:hypothetical protein
LSTSVSHTSCLSEYLKVLIKHNTGFSSKHWPGPALLSFRDQMRSYVQYSMTMDWDYISLSASGDFWSSSCIWESPVHMINCSSEHRAESSALGSSSLSLSFHILPSVPDIILHEFSILFLFVPLPRWKILLFKSQTKYHLLFGDLHCLPPAFHFHEAKWIFLSSVPRHLI